MRKSCIGLISIIIISISMSLTGCSGMSAEKSSGSQTTQITNIIGTTSDEAPKLQSTSTVDMNTDEDKRIALYVTSMKAAFLAENGGNGYIAVKLDTLKGLENQKDREKVLEGLKELSHNVCDNECVKDDEAKFKFDNSGRETGTINGTVLWVELQEYQEDKAVITAVSWFGNLGAVFPKYKAVYKDGVWHLSLIEMGIS